MSASVGFSGPTRAEIEQVVIQAVARVLQRSPDDIHLTSRLDEDLALDSLALIRASISVERELGDRVAVSEAPKEPLRTVQDLVDLVASGVRTEARSC